MIRPLLMLSIGLLVPSLARAQDRMSPELLWKLGRVGEAAISPAGDQVLYSVRRYELAENKGNSDLFLVPLGGGEARQLTSGPDSESDVQWVKTTQGTRVFFTSKRGEAESAQVWSMDPEDGSLTQITDIEGGVSNLKVAATGDRIAFTRDVKLDAKVNEVYPDLPKADARIIDGLLYRHWDSWHDYKYSHLFIAPLGDDLKAGEARDLMAGLKFDCPVPPFGGSEQFNWSSDGREIAYTMKVVANPAESTDTDVYLQSVEAGSKPRCITTGMDGYDMEPVYSPDSRWLTFMSMLRPGFESDRNRIMLFELDTGEMKDLTEGLDQMAHAVVWAPDSSSVFFQSETRGTDQLYRLQLSGGAPVQISEGRFNYKLSDVSPDGATLLIARQNMIRPWELGTMAASGGEVHAITDVNADVYKTLQVPSLAQRFMPATDGKKIHCWVIFPPDFDPEKSWPMLTYCQGGPQGQIGQWFSYRWNFHLMAARGYVVLAVNRRGLPGFGREWNDQISGDWGGQAMQDILAATDDMLTEPYVDKQRVGAIGASFGGYTVYWLMGNHQNRFASMVAHAGLFNLESFYGSTEELFFANWDVGGPYFESEELQKKYDFHSPHRYAQNWDTPLLVVHGQKDYRVPVTQGIEAFTSAQVQGVPSRFLYFPEEGHWVLSPQNGVLWHRVFFDWLDRSLKVTPGS